MSRTIGGELDKHKGIGPGFDFLRVFLAFSVVASHAYVVLGVPYEDFQFAWFMAYWVLAMFFSLSGFLIAGSALRLSLRDFLINRGLRIIPALVVEILLAAFVLGPICTTLPLKEYFKDPQFLHYMTNLFGWINYQLPGVFKDHVHEGVNISLRSIPFEFCCYAIISELMVLGLLKRPAFILWSAVGVTVIGLIMLWTIILGVDYQAISYPLGELVYDCFYDRGSHLFVAFLLGITFFLNRHRIPYDFRIFLACVGCCVLVAAIDPIRWGEIAPFPIENFPILNLTVALPLTYIMAYIGVTRLPRMPLFHRGDYSYGIYLYSFPIQQALVDYLPTKNVFIHFVAEVCVITPFAVFSWHFIEKPILSLRKKFSFVARVRGVDEEGGETFRSRSPLTRKRSDADSQPTS